MNTSQYAAFNELEDEVKQEFYEDFYAAVKEINQCAEILEAGADAELITRMFRSLHTIKGNCNMVFLTRFVDVSHKLEDLFSNIRSGQIEYHDLYGKFSVASVNIIETQVKNLLENQFADDEILARLEEIIHTVQSADDENKLAVAEKAIIAIDNGHLNLEMVSVGQGAAFSFLDATDAEFFKFVSDRQSLVDPQHAQFISICTQLACELNAMLSQSIEESQLETAVIFLTLTKRLCNDPQAEDLTIEQVFLASGLLSRMSGWNIAADVVLQCFENFDGKGAPKGLSGDEILPAAQVVGLAFEFALLVMKNLTKGYKESLFCAVKLINSKKDARYKSRLIERFNRLIKADYLNQPRW